MKLLLNATIPLVVFLATSTSALAQEAETPEPDAADVDEATVDTSAHAEPSPAPIAHSEEEEAEMVEPDPSIAAPSEPAADPRPAAIELRIHRDDDALAEDEDEEEPAPSPFDPHEAEGDSLFHFGAFFRGIFVPQYGQNFFVAGGNDALRPAAGVFFNYRRDGFNLIAEVWWANFFNVAPYHGLNETDFETEWIESELSVLFVGLVAMWSIPLTSFLAIEIGVGLGMGGIFGGLYRTEAYPDPGAAAGWSPCTSPQDPNDPRPGGREYCDDPDAGGSYQRFDGTAEPYNFEGGVPPLWFWVEVPRVALRFKPIRQLQIRAEGGFALYGFHFGASAAIGF